ncbi:MAG: hypothetical protein Q8R11_01380 [bacterium]|nr:hypothetical protein [bacterium]
MTMQANFSRLQQIITELAPFAAGWLVVTVILFGGLIICFRLYRSGKRVLIFPGNLVVLFLIVTTFLLPLEIFFRFFYDTTDNFALATTHRWVARHVVYNSLNFRDREFSGLKDEGVVRIGVIGDSFTYGQGINDVQNRLTNMLENRLRDQKVEIYNLGRVGASTRDQMSNLVSLQDPIAQFDFDALLLVYVLNDIDGDMAIRRLYLDDPFFIVRRREPIKAIFDHSFALEFLLFRASAIYHDISRSKNTEAIAAYHNQHDWEEHQKTFLMLKEFAEATQTPLAVVVFPFVHALEDPSVIAVHEQLAAFFSRFKIPFLDLRQTLLNEPPGSLTVGRFDVHPNEKANALAVAPMIDFLFSKDLLRPRATFPSLKHGVLQHLRFETMINSTFLKTTDGQKWKLFGLEKRCQADLPPLSNIIAPNTPITISAADETRPNDGVFVWFDVAHETKQSLNETLLREGIAMPARMNYTMTDAIRMFGSAWQARLDGKGIWRTCSFSELFPETDVYTR